VFSRHIIIIVNSSMVRQSINQSIKTWQNAGQQDYNNTNYTDHRNCTVKGNINTNLYRSNRCFFLYSVRVRKLQSDKYVLCWGSCSECVRWRRLHCCDAVDSASRMTTCLANSNVYGDKWRHIKLLLTIILHRPNIARITEWSVCIYWTV